MRTQFRMLALGLCLALTPAAAHASDFCLQQAPPDGAITYVGKDFRPPAWGKCKPWQGFILIGSLATPYPSTGTACTSSVGDHMSLSIATPIAVFAADGIGTITELTQLPLPLGSAPSTFDYRISTTPGGTTATVESITVVPCPEYRMPIP